MKILKLIIKDYQQFKNIELDFTNPSTGEPLDKVCFIGRNATGKSTILNILVDFLKDINEFKPYSFHIFKLKLNEKNIYSVHGNKKIIFLDEKIDEIDNWLQEISDITFFAERYKNYLINSNFFELEFEKNNSLIIFSPAESSNNKLLELKDVPNTFIELAKNSFSTFGWFYNVTNENIDKFWELLILYLDKRKEDYFSYIKKTENKTKTIEQIDKEFDLIFPNILEQIAKLWAKILKDINLYFDFENAELSENLKAYIKLKNDLQIKDSIIPYNKLSTGIRNFIFKIGHIYSLYFNRKIENGFLLIDEPENSLFPDFLYDLIDEVYCKIIENQNTQFFVSTHNPIIATQFEPYERIILDFDDDGYVYARKGTVPVGDDPNDILFKDFGMRSLLTQKGLKKWERFIKLEELIKNEKDTNQRFKLMNEYLQIGTDYNFTEDEIFTKKQ